jgi:hypothetical protein
MSVETRQTSPFRLIGRHPWASAMVAGILFIAAVATWWITQLWGLPDIGEPFDIRAFTTLHVPDDRNAFFEYRDAASAITALRRANKNGPDWQKYAEEWSKADPAWQEFVAKARPALDIWRAGSERPDYFYPHPEGMGMKTLLPVTQELGFLGRVAILEGSRLEESGDMAGAWGWYRAALRASRHNGRHGFMVERLGGAHIHDLASKALTRWSDNPKVDAALLRTALGEVIAADAMTWPQSRTVKTNHLMLVEAMHDPNLVEEILVMNLYQDEKDWSQMLQIPQAANRPLQHARVLAGNERERSMRVMKLMTANWLAQIDKPANQRAKIARADPPIYDSPGPLTPEELGSWLDSSLFASRFYRAYQKYQPNIDRERPRQARLVVHLADQLYRREHGEPPDSPAALVGPYLKELPAGYDEKP